jgi:hypothetical protein
VLVLCEDYPFSDRCTTCMRYLFKKKVPHISITWSKSGNGIYCTETQQSISQNQILEEKGHKYHRKEKFHFVYSLKVQ